MNRKLQHSITALATTATVFTLLLLAGSPAPSPAGPSAQLAAVDAATVVDTTAALQAPRGTASQRRLRHSRAVLALPYFSFAQGLRRNRS